MTHYVWNASTGDWATITDWAPGGTPNAATDDVLIDLSGSFTLTIAATDPGYVVNSVTLDGAGAVLSISDTLTLAGASQLLAVEDGQVVVAGGGTIAGGTIDVTGGDFTGQGGTLDGVAFEGTLDLSVPNAELTVTGGTTFSGAGGTGPAAIDIASTYHSELDVLGTGTLDNATVNIGEQNYYSDPSDNDPNVGATILNRDIAGAGAILTLGPNLTIDQTNHYARLDSTDDAGDGIVNQGTINAGFAGGFFVIDATNFINGGVITVSNGDLLDFTGAPTAALIDSVQISTGGIVNIGGIVTGGTITAPDGGIGGLGGTLDGVAFEGTLDLSVPNAELTVTGATTFSGAGGTGPAAIDIASTYHSELDVLGTGTLDNATVNIGEQNYYSDPSDNDPNVGATILNRDITGAGAILTLGPNLTIDQTNTYARLDSTDDAGDGIVNQGTINAGFAGGFFVIDATNFTNGGVITVSNGDLLDFTGAPTAALIDSVQISTGGIVNIGGIVTGGTITAPDGGIGGLGGTLDGVAFEGTLDLSVPNAELTVTGATTFSGAGGTGPAAIDIASTYHSELDVLGTGTLDNATVNIGEQNYYSDPSDNDPNVGATILNRDITGAGAILTLGPNLTIDQTNTYARLDSTDDAGDGIVNQGTINAGFAGGFFVIDATNFINGGVITVSNGDLLDFTGAPTAALIDSVQISTGGIVNIGGIVTGGTITAPDGGIGGLGGTLDGVAFEGTLDLSVPNAELTVTGGTTFSGAGGTGPAAIDIASTYHSELDVLGTGTLDNATVNIGEQNYYSDPSDNDPNVGATILNRDITGAGAILTLGPNLTIDQTNTYARLDSTDDAGDGIVNQGTINAGFTGGFFTIDAANFINQGTIIVGGPGSNLDLSGSLMNQGAIEIHGGAITSPGSGLVITSTGTLGGSGTIAGSITDDGTVVASVSGGLLAITGSAEGSNTGSGDLEVGAGGTLTVGGGVLTPNVTFDTSGGGEKFGFGSTSNATTVHDFQSGDTIWFTQLDDSANDVTATYDGTSGDLLIDQAGARVASLALAPGYSGAAPSFTAMVDSSGGTDITTDAGSVACFCAGTRIATARGEVAVEELRVGDLARTLLGGGLVAVKWIGRRRIDLARHPDPHAASPVRVRAHAFADGMPQRDLLLSPEHAVFVAELGGLVPIHRLENGVTIRRESGWREVSYFHVELERHDVILADGMPSESWLDAGNRQLFENSPPIDPATDFEAAAARAWDVAACAPLIEDGAALEGLRVDIAARAGSQGTAGMELALNRPGRFAALVPGDHASLRLTSGVRRLRGDFRRLGALITALRVDGVPLALDDDRLAAGLHAVESHGERAVRWTDGAAVLLLGRASGPRWLEIEVGAVAEALAA